MTTMTNQLPPIRARIPRLVKLASTGALRGDELALAVLAISYALDAVRVASGLPSRNLTQGKPVAPARLFALEMGVIARGDRSAPILGAAIAVARPTSLALAQAALREGLAELARAVDPTDLPAAPPADEEASARASELWRELEEGVFDALVAARLGGTLERVQSRTALLQEKDDLAFDALADAAKPLYENRIDRLAIAFTVDRLPFPCQVLDPRIVRVAPGKSSEHHRHAHESLFYVVAGEGAITVGDHRVAVRAGQCVFVPRWTMHQSHNTGRAELKILGVTDFTFTSKAQVGGDGQGRLKRAEVQAQAARTPTLAQTQAPTPQAHSSKHSRSRDDHR